MQSTLRHIRRSPAPAPGSVPSQLFNLSRLPRTRIRRPTAPVLPSTASHLSIGRFLSSQTEAAQNAWSATTSKESTPTRKLPDLSKDGRLGQAGESTEPSISIRKRISRELDPQARTSIHQILSRLRSGDITHWERLIIAIRHKHGDEGVWEVFDVIRRRRFLHLLTESRSAVIRDHILASALNADDRIIELFEFARQLHDEEDFQWPHLYTKILNFYLDQADYQHAFLWHMRLTPIFPPSLDTFGPLLSSYVVNPSPYLQSCLTAIYVSSSHRKLYDYLIPSLFSAGLSKLARVWRKKLLTFGDVPESPRSIAFLQFLSCYFPTLRLTEEELKIAGLDDQVIQSVSGDRETRKSSRSSPPGGYTDAFTAQWFATSWTSAEFAIDLAHKLGLRVIGPRALQALALREENSKEVANRINQIERLGITIIPRVYSRALVFFAKQGEEQFLSALLACDIHPDEFDWTESRESLMADAAEQGDWNRERLLEAVEWAIKDRSPARELNWLLSSQLHRENPQIKKARAVLDRMGTMNIPVSKKVAGIFLVRVFKNLDFHPGRGKQSFAGYGNDPQLNRAIDVCRRLAVHDVAIRNYYWAILLYSLGRWGRFDELERLSLDIVRYYKPSSGGLIPVHWRDLPPEFGQSSPDTTDQKEILSTKLSETQEEFFTPATMDNRQKHSRYSEEFLRAEMGENYKDPVARLEEVEERKRRKKYARYSEEFLRAEIGDKYKGLDQWHAEAERKKSETNAGQRIPNTPPKTHYIPADLPLSHRQHPVQKLFNSRLQRAIVRWGFDKTLQVEPSKASLLGLEEFGNEAFDVARGVHILANLRDEGVLIDKQVIRSTVISRMALAYVPGRKKDRARDQHETAPQRVKTLIDKAWGMEILPPLPELLRQLENQKQKQWSNYSRLYSRAYDSKETRNDFPEEGDEDIDADEDEDPEVEDDLRQDISDEDLENELKRYMSKDSINV